MTALRLPLEGTDHTAFVPGAGLPWFVALFGSTAERLVADDDYLSRIRRKRGCWRNIRR
jgi:hypothetical protein